MKEILSNAVEPIVMDTEVSKPRQLLVDLVNHGM
jgi:hypothetical protein